VEPYCGAASVFFQKPKSKSEIINDLSDDIVNIFEVLRDKEKAIELERLLRLTPLSYKEYMTSREPTTEPIERARRSIYQSFSTIGTDGISRQLSGFRGLKNHESGITAGQEWARYPDVIKAFTDRLKGVIIEHRPALHVIKIYDSPSTLFYLDPPYMMDSRAQRRKLYKHEMGKGNDEEMELHTDLSKVLHNIKGMAIISGYKSELYTSLYPDWRMVSTAARAQSNSPRVEYLWLSPNIQTTMF
jgi:DNA adenine methylase